MVVKGPRKVEYLAEPEVHVSVQNGGRVWRAALMLDGQEIGLASAVLSHFGDLVDTADSHSESAYEAARCFALHDAAISAEFGPYFTALLLDTVVIPDKNHRGRGWGLDMVRELVASATHGRSLCIVATWPSPMNDTKRRAAGAAALRRHWSKLGFRTAVWVEPAPGCPMMFTHPDYWDEAQMEDWM